MSQHLRGSVEVDFGDFGRPQQSCPFELVINDDGIPERANVVIPSSLWKSLTDTSTRNYRFLNGKTLAGSLSDGRATRLRVGAAIDIGFTDERLLLLGLKPAGVTIEDGGALTAPANAKWRFRLVNFGFNVGDRQTPRPVPNKYRDDPSVEPGSSLARIDATIGGRPIILIDDALLRVGEPADIPAAKEALFQFLLKRRCAELGWYHWRTIRTAEDFLLAKFNHWRESKRLAQTPPRLENENDSHPGGSVSFDAIADETVDAAETFVNDICTLLSLALCTAVNWSECELLAADGQVLGRRHRNVRLTRFERNQTRIDQDYPQLGGVIRQYLEQCYPTFIANRDDLRQAISVYAEAQLAETTIVRAALLNMLLDRLQKEINKDHLVPQIEPDLDRRVDDASFKDQLRAHLATLSTNWTANLTGQIIGEIKRRNSPGFGRAVRLAFERLGVQGFDTLDLGARHVVLHDAELELSVDEVVPYLTELDLLVFLIIACRLGYTGQFWHPHLGNDRPRLETLLRPPSANAPPNT